MTYIVVLLPFFLTNLITCLIETQTEPQQSLVVESDDQLLGCDAKTEARVSFTDLF